MHSNHLQFNKRRVLVTGASSGLGAEMARQLARDQGADLILVARRQDRLAALQQELESRYGVQCQIITADLSKPADVDRIFAESTAQGEVYAVILNAGVTHFGRHDDLSWDAFQTLLATNVTSVVRLVNLFVPYLQEQGRGGGLLLVSSMAGLLPVPYQSAYAGSKGFVTQFGQSLQQELRGRPVSLTVFCPGGIATEMTAGSGLDYFNATPLVQSAQACAALALKAFARRESLPVPGLLNNLQLLGARLLPRHWLARIAANAYRKALPK